MMIYISVWGWDSGCGCGRRRMVGVSIEVAVCLARYVMIWQESACASEGGMAWSRRGTLPMTIFLVPKYPTVLAHPHPAAPGQVPPGSHAAFKLV